MNLGSKKNPSRKLFLIAGCQRSGTTLLRLIMSSHSQINCFDENRAYPILCGGQGYEFIKKTCMESLWCGFKIPRFTEQLAKKTLSDYGLNGECKNFYRQDPILFMTRDPRDVVCSMRALRFRDANWLHQWGIPIIRYWKKNSQSFAETFASELEYAEQSERREVAMGALYWKYKNAAYLQYLDLGYPIERINYESLVQEPKTEIEKAISFLNLPWEDELIAHHMQKHTETDTDGKTIGNTDTRRAISASSMNRYCRELDLDDINTILEITSPLAEQLGYRLID